MEIHVRHAEPDDYEAVQRILAQPRAYTGTLQLPYPSKERWRKRLESPADDRMLLVASVDGEVVGHMDCISTPTCHAASTWAA